MCDVLAELVAMDATEFVGDVRTPWAVEMGLIRIGETINRIPDDVLARFPDLDDLECAEIMQRVEVIVLSDHRKPIGGSCAHPHPRNSARERMSA